jgi:uncharacterized repeat protein (TIGR01451 family)
MFTQSTPAGTTFQSLVAPAGWTCGTPAAGGTGVISCTKSSMTSGESGAFTLVVNVTGSGSITSTVTGGSDASDPDSADNDASAVTTSIAPATADLEITKTTAATNAPIGSTYSYTITVTNHGPDAAANVVMTDTLPSSLLFRSITEPAGFDCTTPAAGTTGTITCTAATMADDATAVFTLVVEVASGASGTIVNEAGVASDTTDSNGGNSSVSAPGVAPEPASADVSIVKTTTTTQASTGDTIIYTITVSNAGPSPATNVVVTDDLPADLDFVSATPSQGTCNAANPVVCNLGTIAADANATITLQAEVVATSGTITNSASVTLAEGPGDSSTAPPVAVDAPATADIPTLSEWALLMLAAMIGVAAMLKMR